MEVHCINLKHRADRKESAINQSKEQGFEIIFWEGIYDESLPPCTCISRSFKKIISFAKENELPQICVMEDDCVFTAPGAWQYFLDNIPSYFDMYIASYYSGLETYNHRIEDFRGMTLIIVHSKFYDKFIALPEDKNIDHALSYHGEYFVSPLFAAIQCPGYSDQMKKHVDYTNKMPEHKLFRGQ